MPPAHAPANLAAFEPFQKGSTFVGELGKRGQWYSG